MSGHEEHGMKVDLDALAKELVAAGWVEVWKTTDQEGKVYLHCHGWAIWETGIVTAPIVLLPHDFKIVAIIGSYVAPPHGASDD